MNIGVLGGTFDPPHIGHLIVAQVVLEKQRLDSILFVPTAIPPHKQDVVVSAPEDRMEMLRLATKGSPRFEISDIEIRRGGVSYTADTLAELGRLRPKDSFSVLIGMDNLREFHLWRTPERILQLATVIVMTRPGFEAGARERDLLRQVTLCAVPAIDISSTEIRRRVKEGKTSRYFVPHGVEEYIRRNGLYRSL